mgnify:FL=1
MSQYTQTSGPRMNVESFNLDHTRVAAPFVRVADRKRLPGGDELVKYDVRFCQPNREHLDMRAVHSIEHLTAELMRNRTDRLIDFGPMGCQTGFYALTLGLEPAEFLPLLEATLHDILGAGEVPAANEVQCGWGANHSLEAAQAAVRDFLAARDEWEVVIPDAGPGAPENPAAPDAPGTSGVPAAPGARTTLTAPSASGTHTVPSPEGPTDTADPEQGDRP